MTKKGPPEAISRCQVPSAKGLGRHVRADFESVCKSVRKFGSALEPEQLAEYAWAIAWEKYWNPDAHDRFAGLSKVSTLIIGIGKHVARRAIDS